MTDLDRGRDRVRGRGHERVRGREGRESGNRRGMKPVTNPLVQLPDPPNLTVETEVSDEEPPNLTLGTGVLEEEVG